MNTDNKLIFRRRSSAFIGGHSLLQSFWAMGLIAFGQSGRGTITGAITDPSGGAVANASIQLKLTETGALFKTASALNGRYTFMEMPAGSYELTIPSIGFSFARYERKSIVLQTSETLRLDVRLGWSGGLGTIGDDTSTIVRNKSTVPTGPTPRASDGRPDFSGVWNGQNDPDPERAPMLPWAEAVVKERNANGGTEHPSNFCLPGYVILTGPLLYKIVQTPSLVVMLWEGNVPGVRQVFLDGRGHPKDFNPAWMGHSVGRWEGDTLVVDSSEFNDKGWIGVYPHTEMLHVTERYRRPDMGHLQIEITVDDAGTFSEPWKIHTAWDLAPGEEIQEYICNENNADVKHLGK
jgi:hypothetical protein